MPGKSGKIRSGNTAVLFPAVLLIPFETAKCLPLAENAFTDFNIQPLQHSKHSRSAPGTAQPSALIFRAFQSHSPFHGAAGARSDKLIIVRFDHAIIDLTVLVRLASDVFLRILIGSDHIFRPVVQCLRMRSPISVYNAGRFARSSIRSPYGGFVITKPYFFGWLSSLTLRSAGNGSGDQHRPVLHFLWRP